MNLFTPRAAALAAAALCALLHAAAAHAQTTPATAAPAEAITIRGHYDNAVGSSDAASQGTISAALLKSRPPLRPGEVLEFVPGLIVTQHSGDGKANQYFLRGFNLDHGTDFATSINGMPVNMVSHGHGQGYTDLNFLIPELVQKIEYRKGPYFATHGDFASAGAADIVYRRRLDAPIAQLSVGADHYRRGVFGGSMSEGGRDLLGLFEVTRNDGPWTVPEGLLKTNAVLGFARGTSAESLALTLMAYRARWTATDQVPQRLIDAGRYEGRPFGRFDSLDASTGGRTSRMSLSGEWQRSDAEGQTRVSAYALRYGLRLWSNFTYAAERGDEEGDQFHQSDERDVFGLRVGRTWSHRVGAFAARSEAGVQLRHDRIRVGLYDTTARRIVATTREDRIRETALGAWAQTSVEFSEKLRGVFGLRGDQVHNRVDALTQPENGGRARGAQASPKLALIAGPFAKTEFFFNAGRGHHSNDARGTTARLDPKSGDAVDAVPPLVASRGSEIGLRTEAIPHLQSSLALWKLDFGSELVYIGDAGATEASAASRRRGVEFNNRWTPVPWFLLDADFAWSHARFANGERIPNAVDRVASVAFTLRELGPWSASLQWRYLGPGALTEDNRVRSSASLTSNLRVSRTLGSNAELTLDLFNLGDRQVNDIQYFYESRVRGESQAVADRHVHPAEPRTLRLTLALKF